MHLHHSYTVDVNNRVIPVLKCLYYQIACNQRSLNPHLAGESSNAHFEYAAIFSTLSSRIRFARFLLHWSLPGLSFSPLCLFNFTIPPYDFFSLLFQILLLPERKNILCRIASVWSFVSSWLEIWGSCGDVIQSCSFWKGIKFRLSWRQ